MDGTIPIASLYGAGQQVPVASTSGFVASCIPSSFESIALPRGAAVQHISASLTEATTTPFQVNFYPLPSPATIELCNVTITYTHPGWNDSINAFVHLPPSTDQWNGRLLGLGGGGWVTGDTAGLVLPVTRGYAAVTTDGGHSGDATTPPNEWLLTGEGKENINWPLLQNFAAVAQDDAASLGKEVVKAFYGEPAKKSYFSGCSTGGRQGFMLAQRYPTQYDGILAVAPAFNWDKFLLAMHWPIVAMNEANYFAPSCELEAITIAALTACDFNDGVKDGIVVDDSACSFDPSSVVGQEINCPDLGEDKKLKISEKAANLVKQMWEGPVDEVTGKPLWYGFYKDTSLLRVAGTDCTDGDATKCKPVVFPIPEQYLRLFVAEDPELDVYALTHEEFTRLFRRSVNKFSSVLGSADADLTDFKRAGGKLVTWHGGVDSLIPIEGTRDYVERVKERDPEVDGYLRYFEAPGIDHCMMGEGWYPGDALESVVNWVEKGEAPERLEAVNVFAGVENSAVFKIEVRGDGENRGSRKVGLCVWPKKLKFNGGDGSKEENWSCA